MADYPKIQAPAGFVPPDDKQPGDTFTSTVDFRIEEDSQLCLLTIDGVPTNEEGEEPEVATEQPAPTLKEAAVAHRAGGYQM